MHMGVLVRGGLILLHEFFLTTVGGIFTFNLYSVINAYNKYIFITPEYKKSRGRPIVSTL